METKIISGQWVIQDLVGHVVKFFMTKVKKLETMIEEVRVAVGAYYRSTGRLPGDDNNDSRITGTTEIA